MESVSSVGTATLYGLDGPGIESRREARFSALSLLYIGYQVSFPGVKRQGRCVKHAPLLAPRLRKE